MSKNKSTDDCFILNNLLEALKVSIVIIIAVLILFFLCVPILLWRNIVKVVKKCMRPDLGEILSPCSSFLASDDLYNHPTCTLTPTYFVNGIISPEAFTERMSQILCKNNYKELTQTLTSWMGFYFWKKMKTFSLGEHLTFNNRFISEVDVYEIQQALLRKPYDKRRPLWEIFLYSNFKSTSDSKLIEEGNQAQTVVIGRFHHCLADGYALLNLLNEITECDLMSTVPKPSFQKTSVLQKIYSNFRLCLIGPIELAHSAVKLFSPSPWMVKPKDTNRVYISAGNDEFLLEEITQTAKAFRVSSIAVIFSAFAGGVRKFMEQENIKIPKTFITMFPLPVPGVERAGCLTNHMTVVPVNTPLYEPNPMKRIYESHAIFENLRESSLPYGYYAVMNIAFPILSLMARFNSMASAQLTNFPGPLSRPTFQDLPVTHFNYSGGIPLAFTSTEFTAHSFCGKLYLKCIFDTSLFEDLTMAQQQLKFIVNEFKILINVANLLRDNENKI